MTSRKADHFKFSRLVIGTTIATIYQLIRPSGQNSFVTPETLAITTLQTFTTMTYSPKISPDLLTPDNHFLLKKSSLTNSCSKR